MATLPTPTPN